MLVLCLYFGMLYYKNVSLVIAKLREMNVVIVLVLALSNWSIDIARPAHSASVFLIRLRLVCVCLCIYGHYQSKVRFGILAG